eukprot:15210700-Alexandrium_andersonii.AAC.1
MGPARPLVTRRPRRLRRQTPLACLLAGVAHRLVIGSAAVRPGVRRGRAHQGDCAAPSRAEG